MPQRRGQKCAAGGGPPDALFRVFRRNPYSPKTLFYFHSFLFSKRQKRDVTRFLFCQFFAAN